jgi:hypothetical protein
MARAQQLAALATHDPDRRRQAEEALVHALFDPDQLAATTDPALCHGYAGLAHLAARVAADATPDRSATLLAGVLPLLEAVHPLHTEASDHAGALIADTNHGPGFLNGAAGIALALLAPITGVLPASPWDACLLVS